MTTNRKIARASLVLIAANLLVFLLGFGKEVLVAAKFGISNSMDAFYAASAVPNVLNNVILSLFIAVFIPVFIRFRNGSREEADRVASATVNYIFISLAALSTLVFALAPWIVQYGFSGFTPETAAVTVYILRVICFSLVLTGLTGAMVGILNAQECFFVPAVSQALVSLTTIAFILLFYHTLGVMTLVYGLLAGLALQFVFLLPLARARGYRHSMELDLGHPAIKELLVSAGVFFVAIVATQMNVMVDKIMAASLPPGSISALTYADRVAQVPLIIFSGALATAVFPFFSSQAAGNKLAEMKDSLARSFRMAGFIFIPVTVLTVIFARPLIHALFQRGAFDAHAADLTAAILICYAFQYVFYTASLLASRVFLATGAAAALARIAVAGFFVHLALNIVFMRFITPPAAGIALSTPVTYLFLFAIEFLYLKKRMDYLHGLYILKGWAGIAAASALMGLASYAAYGYVSALWPDTAGMALLANVAIASLSGFAVFACIAYFFRFDEVRQAGAIAMQKLKQL